MIRTFIPEAVSAKATDPRHESETFAYQSVYTTMKTHKLLQRITWCRISGMKVMYVNVCTYIS